MRLEYLSQRPWWSSKGSNCNVQRRMYVQEITVPRHAHHLTKFCFNLSPNCLPATITRMAHTILPLPGPPSHTRPPLQLWGSGLNNFGQLGMGENVSDTNDKLKRNLWAEENLTSNLFGSKLSRQEEHIFFSSMKMAPFGFPSRSFHLVADLRFRCG